MCSSICASWLDLTSSFLVTRVWRITNNLSPLVSIFHDPYQLWHWSHGPVLDVRQHSCPRSAMSSGAGCCALDSVFSKHPDSFPSHWFVNRRNKLKTYASFICFTVTNKHVSVRAVLRTHSFILWAVHDTLKINLRQFISKAFALSLSIFCSVQLSQQYYTSCKIA